MSNGYNIYRIHRIFRSHGQNVRFGIYQYRIDHRFKFNYSKNIESLKSTGGGDIAEDIAGAFEMALKKDWQGISRFAILAADAPCHGVEFHGRVDDKKYDNYPEGDPENRDIKKFVRNFAEKNISLFCAKFSDDTDMMFDIFRKEYNKGIKEGQHCQFTTEKCEDLCEIIIKKAALVYQVNTKEE